MKVDVVIPTYNRLWALKRVIPYYLGMSGVGQVIIVDDNSSDGTGDWLSQQARTEPRLRILTRTVNRGASAARNTGADACQAPLVFFADDDMFMEPNEALSVLVNELQQSGGDLIAPVFIYDEHQPRPQIRPQAPLKTDMLSLCSKVTLERRPTRQLAVTLPEETFVTGQMPGVILVRRAVLDRVRYDEGLGLTSYRDETDFQLKALAAGYRLLACPGVSLVDMAREGSRGGCHASTTQVGYEWQACKNNWRVLNRHRRTVRSHLGVRLPVEIMHLAFLCDHMGVRLARYFVGGLLRTAGLRR